MRSFVLCALLMFAAVQVFAEEPRVTRQSWSEWLSEGRRMQRIEDRAFELRPHRRDTPLREVNISDNEVREVQDIASQYAMNTMLNISPVVAGCPCEEGPLCTDQVYVIATLPEKTVGLQLSRVRNAWVVGAVQKWWLRYDVLLKEGATAKDYEEFRQKRNRMLLEFPACALKEGESDVATTAQSGDIKK